MDVFYDHRDFLHHVFYDKCTVKCHFLGDSPEGQRHSHYSTVHQRHAPRSRVNFATRMVKAFMSHSQHNRQNGRRAKMSSRDKHTLNISHSSPMIFIQP